MSPKKRLDDVIHLAELCIEVLQQNEEHHAEVSIVMTTEYLMYEFPWQLVYAVLMNVFL